jgi:cell filamentation protein
VSNYTYLGTQTLKNKFGIRDHRELERVEAPYIQARLQILAAGGGPKGNFDAAHLRALHRFIFERVYEWAGHMRQEAVTLSDGTIATMPMMQRGLVGRPFYSSATIEPALAQLAATIRKENFLQGLGREAFAHRAADFIAQLNSIHPFRDGNGRTQRAFFEQLALQAGHALHFEVATQERMAEASVAAHERGENDVMRRLFRDIIEPDRVAALLPVIRFLKENSQNFNDRYIAVIDRSRTYNLTLAGISGSHFMATTQSQILVGFSADLPNPKPEIGDIFIFIPK